MRLFATQLIAEETRTCAAAQVDASHPLRPNRVEEAADLVGGASQAA